MDPNRKCQILNSRRLLREESTEHTNKCYNIFAKNKRIINQEILEKGTGKEPVLLYSPQPIREFDYTNPISIQFAIAKNSKIRVIKSNDQLDLPSGIQDAKMFVDFVKLYTTNKEEAKQLSLQSLLEQAEEIDKLKKKIEELETKLKNAATEIKKNPFSAQEIKENKAEMKISFCKKCHDLITDDDLKAEKELNKELLDFNDKLKKKITGVGLLKAFTESRFN